jgi:hypothetical protein
MVSMQFFAGSNSLSAAFAFIFSSRLNPEPLLLDHILENVIKGTGRPKTYERRHPLEIGNSAMHVLEALGIGFLIRYEPNFGRRAGLLDYKVRKIPNRNLAV